MDLICSQLLVLEMTPAQEKLFREMLSIISNPKLSLVEMYDLLDVYLDIDPVTDDSVMVFQSILLQEMNQHLFRLDDVVEGEIVQGLLE